MNPSTITRPLPARPPACAYSHACSASAGVRTTLWTDPATTKVLIDNKIVPLPTYGTYVDVKTTRLPSEAFDMITAMDVFEHLVDPIDTVEELWRALRPGGFLFGRFGTESDDNHPMHIVEDFEPTFARLRALGGVEVWRDQWLWGHQVFRKAS